MKKPELASMRPSDQAETVKHTPVRYIVSYKYDRPSPAGPFGGRTTTETKYVKGGSIRAIFGSATVVSCRIAKATGSTS